MLFFDLELFAHVARGQHPLAYTTGIDTSDVRVVRSGVRSDDDLVRVGRAPNTGARFLGISESTYAPSMPKVITFGRFRSLSINNGSHRVSGFQSSPLK